MTPADLEISRLQSEITETAEANAASQQQWLSQQRELVTQQKVWALLAVVDVSLCIYLPVLHCLRLS